MKEERNLREYCGEVSCGEAIFHCYKNGHENTEYYDTLYGILYCGDPDRVDIVREDTVDLSDYAEVRMIDRSSNDAYWYDLKEDLPENFRPKARKVLVILPDNSVLDYVEIIDEILAEGDLDVETGVSSIDYVQITPWGADTIEEEDMIDDDDDHSWGNDWYADQISVKSKEIR